MNIAQLQTFLAVAKTGSFSKAAGILRSTTSTVSVRVKELESNLGILLFERSKQGVVLTADGRLMCSYAEKAVSAFEDIRAMVGSKHALSGMIRLGAGEMVAVTWLQEFIRLVRTEYPKLTLEISIDLTTPLMDRLQASDLDLILVPGLNFDPHLTTHPLGSVEFSWMEGGPVRLSNQLVSQEGLKSSRILSYGKASFHYQVILDSLGGSCTDISIDFLTSLEVIVSLVKGGMGIGLLPIDKYRDDIESGELRMLRTVHKPPPVQFFAVHRNDAADRAPGELAVLARRASTFSKERAGEDGGPDG